MRVDATSKTIATMLRLLRFLPARGLLRRLLRRCFRLSLLRHCCPPSLSGWRHRCSAVANRRALPSDYYSRRKIIVTPLNFVCKGRAFLRGRISSSLVGKHATEKFLQGCAGARENSTCRGSADEIRVFSTSSKRVLRTSERASLPGIAHLRCAVTAISSPSRREKKFCGKHLHKARCRLRTAQNARIGAQLIRADIGVACLRTAVRGTGASEILAFVSVGRP